MGRFLLAILVAAAVVSGCTSGRHDVSITNECLVPVWVRYERTDTGTEVARGATRRFPVAKKQFVYIGRQDDFGALALGAGHWVLGKQTRCG